MLGYYVFSGGKHSLLACAYMTVITLTTVGFGEAIEVQNNPGMEVFTIFLITLGMGATLYFGSALTAFIIDGELRDLIRLRRMERIIEELEDHFIVAGIGNTGEYVLNEIHESQRDCVVIDNDEERIHEVREELEFEFPYILGDALDDDTLVEAGIDRADAVICSLGSDRDNLFVTISANNLADDLNPDLKIITRGSDPDSEEKFISAGATSVIYTNVLGGMRMAAEAIRPEVTTFLDLMMREEERDHSRRVEEISIPEGSPLIGQTLANSSLRQHTDALIIAVYDEQDDDYVFNPGPDYQLDSQTKLIMLTRIEDIETIEKITYGDLAPTEF
jgi:voltage-gated potassium channel